MGEMQEEKDFVIQAKYFEEQMHQVLSEANEAGADGLTNKNVHGSRRKSSKHLPLARLTSEKGKEDFKDEESVSESTLKEVDIQSSEWIDDSEYNKSYESDQESDGKKPSSKNSENQNDTDSFRSDPISQEDWKVPDYFHEFISQIKFYDILR